MPIYRFDNLGSIGIIKDMIPSELPDEAWTGGNNVCFRDGIPQNILGDVSIFGTPSYKPENLLFYPDPQSGTPYWIYPGDDGVDTRISAWDGLTHTDKTSIAIQKAYNALGEGVGWSSGSIAGVPYVNNGREAPWVWLRAGNGKDLDPNFVQVSTWPAGFTAGIIRPFLNFWVLIDITDASGLRNPSRLMWSDPAQPYQEPSSFIASDINLAGDVILGDTPDYLVDCLQMRGINIVYKRNEIWGMRPVSGSNIFEFNRIFKDVGMISARCGVSVNGTEHLVVTNDKDVIIHNGHSKRSVIDAKNRNTLFGELDEDALNRMFVAARYQQEEIWICYPTSGNTLCNKAAVFNYMSSAWSFRDLDSATDIKFGVPFIDNVVSNDEWDLGPDVPWDTGPDTSWSQFVSSLLLEQDIMSTITDFRSLDIGNTFNGTAFNSTLEKTGITFGEINKRKELTAIYPNLINGKVDISVGTSDFIGGPYNWSAYKQFDPVTERKFSVRKNGLYHGLRIRSAEAFRLRWLDCEVNMRGMR